MNIYIEFGGFYSSVHSDYINNLIESEIDYSENTISEADFNYEAIYKEYCKYYLKYLFKQITEWYSIKLTVKSKDIGLFSPKYYNYETDKIIWNNIEALRLGKKRLKKILDKKRIFR